jgi:hypothetical protein
LFVNILDPVAENKQLNRVTEPEEKEQQQEQQYSAATAQQSLPAGQAIYLKRE